MRSRISTARRNSGIDFGDAPLALVDLRKVVEALGDVLVVGKLGPLAHLEGALVKLLSLLVAAGELMLEAQVRRRRRDVGVARRQNLLEDRERALHHRLGVGEPALLLVEVADPSDRARVDDGLGPVTLLGRRGELLGKLQASP